MGTEIHNDRFAPLQFPVPNKLTPYIDEVVNRMAYIYPDLGFVSSKMEICVSGANQDNYKTITRDIRYSLYRAKIREESTELRKMLYFGMFSK